MTWLTVIEQFVVQNEGGASAAQGAGMWEILIQVGLILAIFYFLLIRPQQKQQKQMKEMLSALQRDDEIITTGGIHGKIVALTETMATLEVAQNVRIKVQRANIAGKKHTDKES